MTRALLGLIPLAVLAGCVTTRTATADERAYCERMAQDMGTRTSHDHGEAKGLGPNAMNLSHRRCQQILAAR